MSTRRQLLTAVPAVLAAAAMPAVALAASGSSEIEALFWQWWRTVDENRLSTDMAYVDRMKEIEGRMLDLSPETPRDLAMQIVATTWDGGFELGDFHDEIRALAGIGNAKPACEI